MLKMDETAVVLIDVQGKLATIMHESDAMLDRVKKLLRGAQLLGIPIIWMEQYPKGLGSTTESIQALLEENNEPIAKMIFSACGSEDFQTKAEEIGAKNYLVAGIEAHICVYQTVKELLEQGHYTEVVQDAVSSRTLENKQIAMQKMASLGAEVTSVEMALFELMRTAEHPNFKDISKIIK